jgi:bacillolysin
VPFRRIAGVLVATLVCAGSLVALARSSYAGSVTTPSLPLGAVGSAVDLLEDVDGAVTGLVARNGPIALPRGVARTPKAAASAHLERFAARLGVDPAGLRPVSSAGVGGGTTVRLQQYVHGLPVVGGEVIASLDRRGGLEALVGETTTGLLDVTDGVLGADGLLGGARSRNLARTYVAERTGVPALGLRVESEGQWIYNPSLLGAPGLPVNRETTKLHVRDHSGAVDYTVFVDPGFEAVALAVDNNHAAVDRAVCDLANSDVGTSRAATCDGSTVAYSRREGDAATGITDVDTIYTNLGDTARWFSSYADVDVSALVGGSDKTLRATTRACVTEDQKGCPMPNAFWNTSAQQMIYGDGVTALDVTAHELAHGITEHTAGLYYVYQSGAINESMSDVFGELVDQAVHPDKRGSDQAWLIGEDNRPAAEDLPVPMRNMADPTASQSADRLTSPLWDADPEHRDDGGVHSNAGPGNKAAALIADGGSFNGYRVRGLGLAKTFTIYWTALNLLTSGADYEDLFHVLPLSCRKNIGGAGTGLTESDCVQVAKSVRATEMQRRPTGAVALATRSCPDGASARPSRHMTFDTARSGDDAVEASEDLGSWTVSGAGGQLVRDVGIDFVKSGTDALGLTTDVATSMGAGSAGGGSAGVGSAGVGSPSSATSITLDIPPGSFLRFDLMTAFALYQPVEGVRAKLEYAVDGGPWQPASTLGKPVHAGPWSGHSGGWSSARYDLRELGGHQARFRFTVAGPPAEGGPAEGGSAEGGSVGNSGSSGSGSMSAASRSTAVFGVDNFKVYSCG